MEAEDIQRLIELAAELLVEFGEPKLDERDRALLQGILAHQKYPALSQDRGSPLGAYPSDYIAKAIAHPLYKRLTRVMREAGILSPTETLNQKRAPEYLRRLENRSQLPPRSTNNNDELRYWVGRKSAIAQYQEQLLEDCRILEILGITGIGKTFLTKRLLIEPALSNAFPELIALNFESPHTCFETLVEALLGDAISSNPEPYAKYPERVIRALINALQESNCIVVLDLVEESLEIDASGVHFRDSRFTLLLEEVLRVPKMSSRILLTSQISLPVLNEGRYLTRIATLPLSGLDESESLELFAKREIVPLSGSELDILKRIICVHAGHPLTLSTIAGEIREAPYNGSILAYWNDYGSEIEGETARKDESAPFVPRLDCYSPQLTDYVKIRVERSFARLLDSAPLAALLLAMGARHAEPITRQAWLNMLFEYPEEQAILALDTLQRRFLLNGAVRGERAFYGVHPLIRRVALDNLNRVEERLQEQE